MQRQQLKSSIGWVLYDWANSAFPTVITTFIFAAYFTQNIARDPISGTHQWGNATALAGLIIALFSPVLGATADYLGRLKPWIAIFTFVTVISCLLLWFAKPDPAYIDWTLGWVVLGTIGFEMSSVFYNAMMRNMVPEEYLGRLSGWSFGVGYLGGLCCLCLALVMAYFPLPGLDTTAGKVENIRIAGPLVALWFTVFSIPFFIFTLDRQQTKISFGNAFKQGIRSLSTTVKNIRSNHEIFRYLLAHMIYIDGLNTLFIFGGIYAAGTFNFSKEHIILLGILMNVTASIGAIGFAWLDDYLGSKKTILLALLGLIICLSCLLKTYSIVVFWILALFLGLFVGPVQSASRSLMSHLAPFSRLNELFGFYAFSGKITAFLGPWILGLVTMHFGSQRIGMASIILFLIIGGALLLSIKGNNQVGQ